MSKGKYHSIRLSSSGIHSNHDMHEALLRNDFLEFSVHFNIEEFFQWLFEVERFFEYRKMLSLLRAWLRKVHGIGGINCKRCVLD